MSGQIERDGYRPDIDGLRSIAVGSVLLYHYGLTVIPGGFVGVDIFFVISGYLNANILAHDISSGGLSITSFYSRRIRRNMPEHTNRELAELIQLGNVFKSFESRPIIAIPAPSGAPVVRDLNARRIADIVAIKKALDAYHAANGAYPEGAGLRSIIHRGADWIPGLAPKYIPQLPRDPSLSTSGDDPQHMYQSDTKGFKLIAHGVGSDCDAAVEQDGIRMDPARIKPSGTCWAFGFWTEGFETF